MLGASDSGSLGVMADLVVALPADRSSSSMMSDPLAMMEDDLLHNME
jgi:hypothetical protein